MAYQGWPKALIGALHWLKWAPEKIFSDFEDLYHFASITFHYVACLYVCGRFLESFLVAQYNTLVRFYLVCRSDARHSDNWLALHIPSDTRLWLYSVWLNLSCLLGFHHLLKRLRFRKKIGRSSGPFWVVQLFNIPFATGYYSKNAGLNIRCVIICNISCKIVLCECWIFSNISLILNVDRVQQTQDIDPVLAKCWPTVYDASPTLIQHWVNVSCTMVI